MGMMVDRSVSGREGRTPDLFLSHSSRDKAFVRKLAEDLTYLEVDAWLDEWELQIGDSLYDVISHFLETARLIGVVIGENYYDSPWARDELKQALARERREQSAIILPLLAGGTDVPPFLQDKVYLDFRSQYFEGLVRLAAFVHGVPKQHIEEAIIQVSPKTIRGSINTLRYVGVEPYVIMSKEDIEEILHAGGTPYHGNRIRFSPIRILSNHDVSPRLRRKLGYLENNVW